MLDVVTSYIDLLKPVTNKASARFKFCLTCPRKMKSVNICGKCGCPLRAKARTKKNVCKLWPEHLR